MKNQNTQITPIEIKQANITMEAKFPSWNKQMSWSDYEKLIVDTPIETVIVSETISLNSEDFNQFKQNLLEDQKWLSGKGGFTNSDPKHNNNRLRVCVYVGGPNAGTGVDHNFGILVDPSGFGYARYCGKLC